MGARVSAGKAKPEKAAVAREAPHLSERQEKWFTTIRDGLKRDTGKSLAEWVKIARACPETKHRARLAWFKAEHGLLQNRASIVLEAAFKESSDGSAGWDDPDALKAMLWTDPAQKAIYDRIEAAALKLEGVTLGPRKGYTAFSREFQFAAARPTKDGVRVGLAVAPDGEPRLAAPKKSEGWSERLKAVLVLTKQADVDAGMKRLLKAAWEAS